MFTEVMNLPIYMITTLRYIMYKESSTQEGKEAKASEAIEDQIIDMV